MYLKWDSAQNAINLDSNQIYLIGDKSESFCNPLMTVVREIRLETTPNSSLIELYGQPDEIQIEDYEYIDDGLELTEEFYFYKLNWNDLFIPITKNGIVNAVYADTYETIMSEGLDSGYIASRG